MHYSGGTLSRSRPPPDETQEIASPSALTLMVTIERAGNEMETKRERKVTKCQ